MVVIVVIGVCGCGKTTIGQKLAEELKISFSDADDFHSATNKKKMNEGIPLNDDDRMPWLISIHKHIQGALKSGHGCVVTCSALKKNYRKILMSGNTEEGVENHLENDILFIYLKGSAAIIRKRMLERSNHFMPVDLLDSQLIILEEPDMNETHLTVNIDQNVEKIIEEISNHLHQSHILC